MGLENSLNVSELLRRLGVKGDSLGSAPLLESIRLSLLIGDLSNLVPPVGTPFGAVAIQTTSGVGTNNKWTLQCRNPGGLRVMTLEGNTGDFNMWVTAANPFGAVVVAAQNDFAFGQAVQSDFRSHTPAAPVAPANVFQFGGAFPSTLIDRFENWLGPGDTFNIEAEGQNVNQTMRISWKEYPAGLNP